MDDLTGQNDEPDDVAKSSRICTFLRVKPVALPTNRIVLEPLDGNVEFSIPRDAAAGPVNNSRERYLFSFDGILTPDAKQDEVFERVAQPLVISTLEGFNGTVFAYGQTGSGKTFTITGGAERYIDRGIIPRTISGIYKELASRTGYSYQVHISYLEIYNEVGYDLLDPTREVQAMEDLPQVTIMEDEEQNIHFKNLSVHRAATEEEALNLLFLGDTNRTISETPMNQASSRSHCIFTISLEARKAGSDVIRHSKLHLVDLAGSERVAKTGVDGTTLKEAKYINLSLHYLEQVIIALQERSMGLSRAHVPYRNSLMTLVLRDSLGGNCKTIMVATVSGEAAQIEESISTCRFAQRVAMVTNEAYVNESMDPAIVIARLKQEVRDLKDEIALLRGTAAPRGPLTPDELLRLRQQLLAFVDAPQPGGMDQCSSSECASINLGGDMMMIKASWQIFKQLLVESRAAAAHGHGQQAAPGTPSSTSSSDVADRKDNQMQALQEQVRKLRLQVQQRDHEIALMVNMLRGKNNAGGTGASMVQDSSNSGSDTRTCSDVASTSSADTAAMPAAKDAGNSRQAEVPGVGSSDTGMMMSALLDAHLLSDRHKAFEVFRQSYRQGQVIEDNKQLLKCKYEEAKALGAAVNVSKTRINELKSQIELWRAQRAAACVAEGRDAAAAELSEEDPREQQAKHLIDQEKSSYKAAFSQLRQLKGEIEHLQLLLEQSRRKLQHDFQQWLGLVARQQQEQQQQHEQKQEHKQPAQQQQHAPQRTQIDSPMFHRQQAQHGSVQSSSMQHFRSTPGDAEQPCSTNVTSSSSNSSSSSRPGSARHPSRRATNAECSAVRSSASVVRPGSARGILTKAMSDVSASMVQQTCSPQLLRATSSRNQLASMTSLDLSGVDPKVLQAAAPHLTGNPEADLDIIKFYEARDKLLQLKLGVSPGAAPIK